MDYFLVSEFTNNVDSFFRSWYFHKRPDAAGGQFLMGPIWDYDLAYGNANYGRRYCATGTVLRPPAPLGVPLADPAFTNEMRCRWQLLRKPGGPLDVARIDAKVEAFAAHVRTAKARDVRRWGNVGKYVWPNNYVGATWDDELKYLRYWIRKRLAWVDARLPGQCATQPAPPRVEPLPQPPPAPNDMRAAQAMAMPPQFTPGTDPPAFVPIEGTLPPNLAAFACPAP